MKRRTILGAVALALGLLCAGGEASAQFAVTITVDEFGNGTLTNTSGFSGTLPSAFLPDPGPGGLASALTYGLFSPPGLVAGDLVLVEPGISGGVSDIIRFNPNQTIAGTTGTMVFYSDNADGSDSPADTGFPSALYTNTLAVVEVGPEGANGFTYTPTAGQPGFVTGSAGPVTYVLHSDVTVPEPSSLVLAGTSAAAWVVVSLARARRRKLIAA